MNQAVMNKIDLLLENASDEWYHNKAIATALTGMTPAEKARLQTIGGRMEIARNTGLKMAKYGALGGALGSTFAGLIRDDHDDDLGTSIGNSLSDAIRGGLFGGAAAGLGTSLVQYANAHTAANMSDKDAARIAKQAREDYGNIWAANAKKYNTLK